MKKGGNFLGVLVLVGIVALLGSAQFGYGKGKPGAVPEKVVPLKKCCIAGDYDGTYAETCPLGMRLYYPLRFYMYIDQAACGSKIKGHVEICNEFYQLSGIVTASGTCCKLEGELRGVAGNPTAGKVIRVNATLCRDARGKWYSNNGVYQFITGRDCGGGFTLIQR